jgi:hypothetical protein
MKWIIYTIALLTIVSSCRSVQELVDKGDYDGAIYLAAEKLHGKKNKKTKHIQGLEEAFAKVNARDFAYLESLNAKAYPERWDKAYDILSQIQRRQDKVSPFLPLISKDGYVGHFEMINVFPLLEEASVQASNYHYAYAELLLENINYTRKAEATEAFHSLSKIDRYFKHFKNSNELKQIAHHYGTTRVLIETRNTADAYIPGDLHDELLAINIPALNSFWTDFYTSSQEGLPMDFKVVLEIDQLEVSPEKESERIYVESKEVKDGFTYVLDQNGNVAKDTLGNDITEDRYVNITVDIIELLREKAAYVKGSLKVIDLNEKQLIDEFPIAAESTFRSYASRYFGDERAITSRTRNRMRSEPERFPADEELIWKAAEDIKSEMVNYIQDIRYF